MFWIVFTERCHWIIVFLPVVTVEIKRIERYTKMQAGWVISFCPTPIFVSMRKNNIK